MAQIKLRHRSTIGFTLIECLIALAISALALSILVPGIGGGLKNISEAERRVMATLHGRSLLAEIPMRANFEAGNWSGDFKNGYVWQAEIVDAVLADKLEQFREVQTSDRYRIVQLTVQVRWTGSRDGLNLKRFLIWPPK